MQRRLVESRYAIPRQEALLPLVTSHVQEVLPPNHLGSSSQNIFWALWVECRSVRAHGLGSTAAENVLIPRSATWGPLPEAHNNGLKKKIEPAIVNYWTPHREDFCCC